MTQQRFSNLDELDNWLTERNLGGFWQRSGLGAQEVKPQHWKWADIEQALASAAELVPMDMVAMRTIQLRNPDLPIGVTQTLHFSIQCLMPGERTKAHRNLVGETRFVLQAPPGAVFVVDGEAFPMGEGDLVITPNWSYHDHYNGGETPAIWLDGMDTRLVNGLARGLNERFETDQQPVTKPTDFALRTLGHVRPSSVEPSLQPPPFRYPWAETQEALNALREAEQEPDPFDGYHLTYVNPVTGGPTLPTYACEIGLLPARFAARTHRHNCTTIYHAFRGSGVTEVGEQRIEWSQGDILVVPPWTWHHHENQSSQDAILYSITDRPALSALGLFREETA